MARIDPRTGQVIPGFPGDPLIPAGVPTGALTPEQLIAQALGPIQAQPGALPDPTGLGNPMGDDLTDMEILARQSRAAEGFHDAGIRPPGLPGVEPRLPGAGAGGGGGIPGTIDPLVLALSQGFPPREQAVETVVGGRRRGGGRGVSQFVGPGLAAIGDALVTLGQPRIGGRPFAQFSQRSAMTQRLLEMQKRQQEAAQEAATVTARQREAEVARAEQKTLRTTKGRLVEKLAALGSELPPGASIPQMRAALATANLKRTNDQLTRESEKTSSTRLDKALDFAARNGIVLPPEFTELEPIRGYIASVMQDREDAEKGLTPTQLRSQRARVAVIEDTVTDMITVWPQLKARGMTVEQVLEDVEREGIKRGMRQEFIDALVENTENQLRQRDEQVEQLGVQSPTGGSQEFVPQANPPRVFPPLPDNSFGVGSVPTARRPASNLPTLGLGQTNPALEQALRGLVQTNPLLNEAVSGLVDPGGFSAEAARQQAERVAQAQKRIDDAMMGNRSQ